MTPVAAPERPRSFHRHAPSRALERDGGVTLEQRLSSALGAVREDARADCPLCGGGLRARGRAAECGDCGSRLT